MALSTKQAKKIDIQTLVKIIRGAKKIMVATHVGPDGDGIGSITALGLGLAQIKKKVTWYMQDPVPKIYRYLPGCEKITNTLNPKDKFDVSFIVDLGEIERVGDAFVNHTGRGVTISLDHHARGAHNADLNFCLPKQASSGEVIFKVLKALKVKINRAMATNIYTAMVTDTGSFKYSNTTQETFAIAAELMKQKVDVWQVAQNCFETFSAPRMELFKRVIGRMQTHKNGKLAWIELWRKDLAETGATEDDSEGFVSYPRSIEGVEIAVNFKEVADNKFKISMRSKNYANVAVVAESFGGGGHIRAAGCKLNGTFDEVRAQLFAKLIPLL